MQKYKILIVLISSFISTLTLSTTQTMEDSRGQRITYPLAAKRIASTSLAGDEILYEILKTANQLYRLIAVSALADNSEYSNITQEALGIKGRTGRELESLISLKPDLIFLASYNQPAMIDRLRKSQITSFVLSGFNSFDEIKHNIEVIGKVIGTPNAAQNLTKTFEQTLTQLKKKAPKKSSTILNFSESMTLSGKNTTFDDIVKAAGATNLARKLNISGWSKISVESLSTLDPDYIVAIGTPKMRREIINKISQTPGYRQMSAVKAKRIIIVEGRKLLAVSHHVLEAISEVQTALLKDEKAKR